MYIPFKVVYTDNAMNQTAELPTVARGRADWMKPIDDAILETLRDETNLTPQAFDDLDVTAANYAGERCRELAKRGLVEKWSAGLYRITDKGRQYLDEQLDARELEPTDSTDS